MKIIQDDGTLVAAVQAGDSAAYGELFERYQKKIYNFCYGILGNPEDARDATQDAFVRVFEALPKKEHVEFSAYVYRAARNLSYDLAKARGRFTDPEALDSIPESNMDLDPVRSALFAEQSAGVREAVASLPEDYRAVLMLREVQELSYQQIADALEMPRNTVGVLIMRARLKFKGAFRMSHVDADKLAAECLAMLPKLSAYIDDELAPAERTKVDAHLDECPLCRLALDQMREASENYRGFIPLIPPPSMLDHVLSRVSAIHAPNVPGSGPGSGAAAGEGAGAGADGIGAGDGAGSAGGEGGFGGGSDGAGTAAPGGGLPLGTTLAIFGGALLVMAAIVAGWILGAPKSAPPAVLAAGSLETSAAVVATAPVEPTATVVATPTVAPPAKPKSAPDTHAPATPNLLSPADGAFVPSSVSLQWSSVSDPSGVRYEVQIDQWLGGGAGWGSVTRAHGLRSTHYGTEATGMKRRWRVRAVDGAGNAGHFTAWRIFFLKEAPVGTIANPNGDTYVP
jgi:RNA polymerase sigma factor (sigma-70 family)